MGTSLLVNIGMHLSILLSFVFVSHRVHRRMLTASSRKDQFWAGLFFGGAGAVSVFIPVELADGVRIGFRGIAVLLAGIFSGGIAAGTSAAIVALCHLFEGGSGLAGGLATIVTAFCLGLAYRSLVKAGRLGSRPHTEMLVLGLALTVAGLAWQLALPGGVEPAVLGTIRLPALILYPASVCVLAYVLRGELRRAETDRQLAESEERYRSLVENSEDFIFSCDPAGRLTSVNRKMREEWGGGRNLTGDTLCGLLAELRADRQPPKTWSELKDELLRVGGTISFERSLRFTDQIERTMVFTLVPLLSGKELRSVMGTAHDITGIRKKERYIEQLSHYDLLTELPNRWLLVERLKRLLERSSGGSVSVVYIDFDRFSRINDTRGIIFGDDLIRAIARSLQSAVHAEDWVARFSADEFVVVSERYGGPDGQARLKADVDRLIGELSQPFSVRGETVHLTFSAGVSRFPEDARDAEQLIGNACTAMYQAKADGSQRVSFYRPAMRESLLHLSKLETALRDALRKNEFLLHYQPVIEAGTGRVHGFEALLRWRHPELGFVPPDEFIPMAEEKGWIVPIGDWALLEACRANRSLHDRYGLRTVMSVNVSPVQLKQPDFARRVAGFLSEARLEPQYLDLEITESVLIDSFEDSLPVLEELNELGVRLSLDDFGTGYSSLSYLKRLPIRTVKIDKSFVQDLANNRIQTELAEAIIALAHKIGLGVVAEGVEREEQGEWLKKRGCDCLQGYWFARPMGEEQLRQYMSEQPSAVLASPERPSAERFA